MPKAQVLAAVASFLDPLNSNITYLGSVYPALPKIANEQDLFQFVPGGTGLGAVIYTFIEDQSERRIASGEANPPTNQGKKMRTYTLSLLCILKSDKPEASDGQAAFDQFVDSLTARIESDRNAGTPDVVFQWGEGDTQGAPDLRFDYPVPKLLNGGVMLFQAVGRITVLELLNT